MAIQVLGDQSAARRDANVQITRSLRELGVEVKKKYGGKLARISYTTRRPAGSGKGKYQEKWHFRDKTRQGVGVTN